MQKLDKFGRAYLKLTLEINEHIEGYVDAYYGPADLKEEVTAQPPREPAALLADLAHLQDTIPTADPARHAYLVATLRALDCTLRLINGETFDYLEEVNRLYDITPTLTDETTFTKAASELDTLLPGKGSLAHRLQQRRQRYFLSPEQILPLLDLARAETRQRTAEFIPLPDDESVDIRLTHDQPWGAYNWYLGHSQSLIEFNTDTPPSALSLIDTFAHEGYPGHHTESLLKEKHIYHEKGYGEQAAMLLHSPAAVIAEGIATTAVHIIFPQGSHHHWNCEVLLPAAAIHTDETAEQMQRIAQAAGNSHRAINNAAILYHTGELNQAQTIDYIQTYALYSGQRAQRSFRFLSHPLFRSYGFTYTHGRHLIAHAAPKEEQQQLFGRLLTEQVLPSQLADAAR